jgi:LEA14-like dessication related protein
MSVRPPELFVQKIKMEKIGITGMSMVLTLDLTNANVHPITLRFFEYSLEINGHKFGKGYFNQPLEFKELERRTVESTLNINFFKLPAAIKSIFDQHTVHARMKGKYYLLDRGHERDLNFESEADIPISK